tara:strand:- start:59 stop:175 length:117 start_codon:yes stop_codon:yes gene_type:complete
MPQYLLIEKIDIYPFEINVNRPALLEAANAFKEFCGED